MTKQKSVIAEINVWLAANAECRKASRLIRALKNRYLTKVVRELSDRERRHLRHTAFRINGLMYLYAKLRRAPHNTRLGVVCGLITHLLDYAYDHCSLTPEELGRIERIVSLDEYPIPGNALQQALYDLAKLMWSMIANRDLVRRTLGTMTRTQRESLVQNSQLEVPQVLDEHMKQLTLMKGYHSLCLYFSIANPNFSPEEARHLKSFGLYMQYMDDLEDFYEDRADLRLSMISAMREGLSEAGRLLLAAQPELAPFYDNNNYDYEFVWGKLVFYHRAICFACKMRERTRRLPRFIQRIIHASKEGVSILIPFIYYAPMD